MDAPMPRSPRLDLPGVAQHVVQRGNDRYHRTGTLWEGRYKACLVGDDRYLLRCHRYIELNPVRARMVADPADYPWSSHRHHAFGCADSLISTHPAVMRLAADAERRRHHYRRLVMEAITPEETDAIRLQLQRQHLYGPDRFRRAIEAQLGRKIGPKKIGRPTKAPGDHSPERESRLCPLFLPVFAR